MKKLFVLGMYLACLLHSDKRLEAADDRQAERLQKLIAALDDSDRNAVLAAMKKLGTYGAAAKEAVPALGRRFRQTDKEIGGQAARTLAQIGQAAVPEVTAALQEGPPAIRARALLTLGTIGHEAGAAVIPVRDLLVHPEAKVRLLAALALDGMHEAARPAADYLARALRDPDRQVRYIAADALFQIGPDMVGRVAAAARDGELDTRINALMSLGRFLNSPDAVKALAEALQDQDPKIQGAAAGSLIRLGTRAAPAAKKLLDILSRSDLETQVRAFTAVLAVSRPDDGPLRDAITALNGKSRWFQADIPKSFGDDPRKTATTLAAFLRSADATERLAALLALARVKSAAKEHVPSLKKCLADPDRSVRCAAMLAVAAADRKLRFEPEHLSRQMNAAIESCKGASDSAEVIRLHLLLSIIPSLSLPDESALRETLEQSRLWVCRSLDEQHFSTEDLPRLVQAINLTAQLHLGFTEPFSRLTFKLQNEIDRTKEPMRAVIAFDRLGKGVPLDSLYYPAIQQQWTRILTRVPVEAFILEKSQKIERLQQVQKDQQRRLSITRSAAGSLHSLMDDCG